MPYPDGKPLKIWRYETLSDVSYDTTIGEGWIVFDGGATSRFSRWSYGGEIALRSWFGFTRQIHANSTVLIE